MGYEPVQNHQENVILGYHYCDYVIFVLIMLVIYRYMG